VSTPHFSGRGSFSEILFNEEEGLPNAQTKQGFDPNAYNLMEKAGYDFNNSVVLRKVVEVETYNLNKVKKKILEQEGLLEVWKVGLGYIPSQLIKISGQRKDKQYIV